jgi:hypothetical protein
MTRYLSALMIALFGLTTNVTAQSAPAVHSLDSLDLGSRSSQANPANTAQQNATELASALANSQPPPQCVNKLKEAVKVYQQTHSDQAIRQLLDFNSNQLCTTYLLLTSDQYVNAAQATMQNPASVLFERLIQVAKTMSQQTGSSVGTGGTTNLVSKGVAAKFISLASEYGALTQSTSNATTTVQGALAGLPVLLLAHDVAEECSTRLLASTPCLNHNVVSVLNRFSYSVSFDTSQNSQTLAGTVTSPSSTSAQPATFTANTHSISAVTGKWIAIPGRQFTPADVTQALTQLTPDQAANVMEHADFFQKKEITLASAFQAWQDSAVSQLDTAMGNDTDGLKTLTVWRNLGTSLVTAFGVSENMPPKQAAATDVIQNTLQLALAYETYLGREAQIASSLVAPPILTLEYDENRPASQPTNSVFRAISQQNFKQLTLTENGAISIYDSTPSSSIPGSSRLRDAQFAFEADHTFSISSAIVGNIGFTASGAFYFQHQNSPAILNVNPAAPVTGVTFTGLPSSADQVYAQKGNIAIGQLRLTIGSGSNFKLPISVTYSNRTELITRPTWGAQVGISYDFDLLFGKAK